MKLTILAALFLSAAPAFAESSFPSGSVTMPNTLTRSQLPPSRSSTMATRTFGSAGAAAVYAANLWSHGYSNVRVTTTRNPKTGALIRTVTAFRPARSTASSAQHGSYTSSTGDTLVWSSSGWTIAD